MKKVGIITFHFADNFGAVLQTYALSKTIEKFDLEVEIIDYVPKKLRDFYNLYPNVIYAISEYGILSTIRILINKTYNLRRNIIRTRNFNLFRNSHFKVSKKINNLNQLKEEKFTYNYCIVGSDQVWNPKFFSKVSGTYFLNFIGPDIKKISYAASIAQEVDKCYYNEFIKHLDSFSHISVREESAKLFLEKIIDKNIEVTLDPTLLLDSKEWNKIGRKNNIKDKYILVYDLTSSTLVIDLANKLSLITGYKIISYTCDSNYKNWIGSFSTYNPSNFLDLIANAEFVVTNSFHGTVFSIIYKRDFYTIPHPTRGSRMIELLNKLDLNSRIIKDDVDIRNSDIHNIINFYDVEKKVLELRSNSMNFLKKSLDIK